MKEHPIVMATESIRAIYAGTKTQTRRVIRTKNLCFGYYPGDRWWVGPHPYGGWWAWEVRGDPEPWMLKTAGKEGGFACPFGVPGDRLRVKETFAELRPEHRIDGRWVYKADCRGADSERCREELGYKWRSPRFMPREAARLFLEVLDVRAQRVQEISEADAVADGTRAISVADIPRQAAWSERQDYSRLWDSLNADRGYPWAENPWVFAIAFRLDKERTHAPDS